MSKRFQSRYGVYGVYGVYGGTNAVGAWWMVGIVLGGVLVLAAPFLWQAIQTAGLLTVAVSIAFLPYGGVLALRAAGRRTADKRRAPKRRGSYYADYAYVIL